MSETMVERVARAICVSEKINDDDALGGWIHWQEAARAAIEAMSEPTPGMCAAALAPDCDSIRLVYRAMISEALK